MTRTTPLLSAAELAELEFEGPRVEEGESRFDDRPRTEEDSIETLRRIVADHAVFFRALARLTLEGHRVVFVAGNHDAQLAFPGVQVALRDAIADLACALEEDKSENKARAMALVAVHQWFYQTGDRIHIEHGHQYDAYCSFRDPLKPMALHGREIEPTVGSLAFRHLISRMGYFNPHDERTFLLTAPRYALHWARYYLFTRRSLVFTYILGGLRVVRELMRAKPERQLLAVVREQAAITRAAYAQALAIDEQMLARHAELFAPPAGDHPEAVVRELQLDNFAVGIVGIAGIVTAAFRPRLGLAITLGALAVGLAQTILRPRKGLEEAYKSAGIVARRVAKIYGARAVVFGHTHIPFAESEDGVLYANAGSWAPVGNDSEEEIARARRGRPVVWLRRPQGDLSARVEGGLYRLRGAQLAEDSVIDAFGERIVSAPRLEPDTASTPEPWVPRPELVPSGG